MRLELKLAMASVMIWLSSVSLAADSDQCYRDYSAGKVLQAYNSCLPLAQVGDPQAAFIVARLYALGVEGGPPNWETAVEWLTRSAAGGYSEAAYNLAIAHQVGKGTPVNLAESVAYYRQSAEQGNPKAMRNLALLYEKGDGVEQDLAQAFSLYQASAEAGLADSQLKIGLMLFRGEGVDQDRLAARRWIEQAAESGYDQAQLALAGILIDSEPANAIEWYQRSAAQGNPYAAHNLALVYSDGFIIPPDLLQALAYADVSIELGNPKTQALYDKILTKIQQEGIKGTALSHRQDAADSQMGSATETAVWLRDRDWLQQQSPGFYAVQLARLASQESALRFMTEYQLQGRVDVVRLAADDYVVLLQDSFADKAMAQNAYRDKLPSTLVNEAWVRSYRSLYAK
ncbi:hypothetical protein EH243_11635 [Amphritea opalescens]|uniref:SPOR domain-containing protein n=1 Tax=Amphritea opalescens TaxID=2490544 RepID=A0A430KQF9_9GAMM|nr:SEL1-like repeat protein [Amphritea opalescens]RTE65584.1 hypothetical protein EH243_11635 [Amphritea opalescens]